MPFVIALLRDEHSATVRAAAIRALTELLSEVKQPTLGILFTEYLLPAIERVNRDSERMVRLAFSECLPQLIGTGHRFLETARAIKLNCRPRVKGLSSRTAASGEAAPAAADAQDVAAAAAAGAPAVAGAGARAASPPLPPAIDAGSDGDLEEQTKRSVSAWVDGARSWTVAELELDGSSSARSSNSGDSFDKQLFEFNSRFEALLNPMLITGGRTSSSLAKRALLEDVLRLCTVLGREAAERAELLLKLGTFLNDPDWELRATLFDKLPDVAAFFGPVATCNMIAPFVQQHLADKVERVASRALECVLRLIESSPMLLTKELQLDLASASAPLLLHPHAVIRNTAVRVQCAAIAKLAFPDAHVLLLPSLQPYLTCEVMHEHIDYEVLSAALLPPCDEAQFRSLRAEVESGGVERRNSASSAVAGSAAYTAACSTTSAESRAQDADARVNAGRDTVSITHIY
jgi:hypothetical protein